MNEPAFQSATMLAQRLRDGDFSARELLEYFLDRVDRFNPALNAIVVDDRERARDAAAAADRALRQGEAVGPLHGVPMTVKESYDVAGLLTTWGDPAWRDNMATEDAVAIQRLKRAGAIIFGKTNVPLHLADWQSFNDIYGTTHNPWRPGRTPGGSSGGSAAALAAGLTGLETGSDIGGSIRNPAHYCGVFGHKPSFELIPTRGHSLSGNLTPADLSVVGPLARSARDLQLAIQIMAGPDQIQARGYSLQLRPPRPRHASEFRVAVWHDADNAPVATEVRQRVDRVAEAFATAGATVNWEARPNFNAAEHHRTYAALLQAAMSGRQSPEDHQSDLAAFSALDPKDNSAAAEAVRRRVLTHYQWLHRNELRTQLRWTWQQFFEEWDILLAPVAATSAFPQDERPFNQRALQVDSRQQPYWQQLFWAGLASLCYLPSTVIPTGPGADGLPIGVQVIGPEYGDLTTLFAAGVLEQMGFTFEAPEGY
jgi:amidase